MGWSGRFSSAVIAEIVIPCDKTAVRGALYSAHRASRTMLQTHARAAYRQGAITNGNHQSAPLCRSGSYSANRLAMAEPAAARLR